MKNNERIDENQHLNEEQARSKEKAYRKKTKAYRVKEEFKKWCQIVYLNVASWPQMGGRVGCSVTLLAVVLAITRVTAKTTV